MKTKFYKRAGALDEAKMAEFFLDEALKSCEAAERHLNASGHKRAAHGVHQAAERLRDWLEKVHHDRADASLNPQARAIIDKALR